jgi:hypothetical protein
VRIWVQCEISGQRHAGRPRELLCAGRNSAVVTLSTFSRLRCLTSISEHPKVVPKMSSYERQRIPGEVMISDSKDRVSREALLRSEPVPAPWAAKFAWSRDWWWNQENGNIAGPHWRPSRDDVERMLGGMIIKGGRYERNDEGDSDSEAAP